MTNNDTVKIAKEINSIMPNNIRWLTLLECEGSTAMVGTIEGTVDDTPDAVKMLSYAIVKLGTPACRAAIHALNRSIELGLAKDD